MILCTFFPFLWPVLQSQIIILLLFKLKPVPANLRRIQEQRQVQRSGIASELSPFLSVHWPKCCMQIVRQGCWLEMQIAELGITDSE